jgi:hypothetical protein
MEDNIEFSVDENEANFLLKLIYLNNLKNL